MSWEITEVQIFKAKQDGKVKAYANVIFDNVFKTDGWKVIRGPQELFVAPPSKKVGEKFLPTIFVVDAMKTGTKGNKLNNYIKQKVLDAYREKVEETQTFNQTDSSVNFDDDVPF